MEENSLAETYNRLEWDARRIFRAGIIRAKWTSYRYRVEPSWMIGPDSRGKSVSWYLADATGFSQPTVRNRLAEISNVGLLRWGQAGTYYVYGVLYVPEGVVTGSYWQPEVVPPPSPPKVEMPSPLESLESRIADSEVVLRNCLEMANKTAAQLKEYQEELRWRQLFTSHGIPHSTVKTLENLKKIADGFGYTLD